MSPFHYRISPVPSHLQQTVAITTVNSIYGIVLVATGTWRRGLWRMDRDWREPPVIYFSMLHYPDINSALIVMSSLVAAYVTVAVLVPTVLRSKLQLHYLHMFGFFYTESDQRTDWVSVQLVLVSVAGQFTLAGTEASLAVFSAYLCGLFDIASYRLKNAVNKMVNSVTVELIDIRSAIEVHQRAVELATNLTKNMMLSYLAAIVAVVASFAINLYRFLLATKQLEDVENLAFSCNLLVSHIIIMFLNNFNGQKLITTSIEFFHQTYNTLWYYIPPKSQKMLLFVLMKSVSEVQFDLAGLFTPCYEGFSMMMSSSFSYFTVLYSIQ
ncbi:uncharacterized protein LOC144477700 isoform X3 [Augochlora pura]